MRTEFYTQAYHAGILVAMIHNLLPKEEVSIVQSMVHCQSLRQVLGERLWQKIKTRSRFKKRVNLYESLAYHPLKSKTTIGTPQDFMLGYVKCYDKSKMKKEIDLKRSNLL